jgi:hypothetical protein
MTGLTTMPLSKRFTWRTCSACSAMVMFLWMTPMPPRWAIAMAMPVSVTVSIAAAISGMCRLISRVRRVRVSAWAGRMVE